MGPQAIKLNKEVGINSESTIGLSVEFHHTTAYTLGIKLFVPGVVERVCEINAGSISTHFAHLRCPIQRLRRTLWTRRATDNAAQMPRAGQLWIKRIGNIVLSHFTGSPT